MAYTINHTNPSNGSKTVEDKTVNTETSIGFPGKNYNGYGEIIAENFLHLLEHFANPTEPVNPVQGQLWYQTSASGNLLQVYDGARWTAAGGLKQSVSRPDAAVSNPGDLWSDTDRKQLYMWTGTAWVLIGPEYSDGLASGTVSEVIFDTTDTARTVLKQYVNGVVVGIISTVQFVPKVNIPGFSTVYPGVTLAGSSYGGSGTPKYYGIAQAAETLRVSGSNIDAAKFLRSDTESITNQKIKIKNNSGLEVGLDSQFAITVSGTSATLEHRAASSNINVKVSDVTGQRITIAHFNANGRLGVNNTAPDEAFHVTGNIKTDNNLLVTGNSTITGNTSITGTLGVTGTVTINDANTHNMLPVTNETYNLGSSLKRWNNIYAKNITIGNIEADQIIGSVTGNASTATRLLNTNSIELTGDVSSSAVTFDGAGATISIASTVSPAFITSKETVTTTVNDDQYLLQRGSELFKISKASLFSSIPRNPIGAMTAYAGASAPAGWSFCVGQEVLISAYTDLYTVIGYTYKPASITTPGYFALPDARGRSMLGLDNMGGTSANRTTDTDADVLGGSNGVDQVTIAIENLPDHEHNLRGYDTEGNVSNQYYLIRDVNESPTDVGSISYDAPTGTQAAQALPRSGKILTNGETDQPLNIMNPYLAVNWIIYHGVDG